MGIANMTSSVVADQSLIHKHPHRTATTDDTAIDFICTPPILVNRQPPSHLSVATIIFHFTITTVTDVTLCSLNLYEVFSIRCPRNFFRCDSIHWCWSFTLSQVSCVLRFGPTCYQHFSGKKHHEMSFKLWCHICDSHGQVLIKNHTILRKFAVSPQRGFRRPAMAVFQRSYSAPAGTTFAIQAIEIWVQLNIICRDCIFCDFFFYIYVFFTFIVAYCALFCWSDMT